MYKTVSVQHFDDVLYVDIFGKLQAHRISRNMNFGLVNVKFFASEISKKYMIRLENGSIQRNLNRKRRFENILRTH